MDWTGGVRRRFAPGKNNSILQKQKAHFAKARAALQDKPALKNSLVPTSNSKAQGSVATQQNVHLRRRHSKHQHPGRPHDIQIAENTTENSNSRQMYNIKSTSFKRQPPCRRSPSVISISSRQSSSSAVSSNYQKPSSERIARNAENAKAPNISEEEQVLLANRRRLLARTDWLGLSARQPLDMKFASSHDKDRIGKRRKVEKSAFHKGRPAGQRLLTPLFFERGDSAGLDLRNKLPSDQIRIKIGTDALASQNQRSRQPRTPGKTSMRHPSTEFGPLSEESMLLGSEGEMFEIGGFQRTTPNIPKTDTSKRVPFSNGANDEMARELVEASKYSVPTTTAPPVPNMIPYSQPDLSHRSDTFGIRPGTVTPDFEIASRCSDQERQISAVTETVYDDEHPGLWLDQLHWTQSRYHDLVTSPSAENDNVWRQMFRIGSPRTTHSSMKALKSSSMHIMTSESGHRPLLEFDAVLVDNDQPPFSTPKGAGTQRSMFYAEQQIATDHSSHIRSSILESPSASFKQVEKLATVPEATNKYFADDEDNALWRQFIIGSQGSSDEPESFNPDGENFETSRSMVQHTVGSPTFTVSGLGTSAKSTLGDTLCVRDATPSISSRSISHPKPVHSSRPQKENERIDAERHDRDSIAETMSSPNQQSAGDNIHTAKRRVLDPKLFKRPTKNTMKMQSKFKRRATSSNTKVMGQKQNHSVYDLIDSD